MDPFVHLHVASGYSLKYGASSPHRLVERAVEADMDTLALTDRDGVYGAVRFAKACLSGESGRCSVSTWRSNRPVCSGRAGQPPSLPILACGAGPRRPGEAATAIPSCRG
ncbi:MAG: PHP domain-containing protein [Nocardioidaceae bacterium]